MNEIFKKNCYSKPDMHAEVEDYCRDWIGEDNIAPYLHDEIEYEEKRGYVFKLFMEYLKQ